MIRSRHFAISIALLLGAAVGWPLRVAAEGLGQKGGMTQGSEGSADGARPTALVHGFRNLKGQLLLAIFRTEDGFPNDVDHALFYKAYPIEDEVVRVRLPRLEAGTYAVAVHHDEDGDFAMKKGLFGIPREGFGTSRDARVRFGPPKFEDARFELSRGQQVLLKIRVRYL